MAKLPTPMTTSAIRNKINEIRREGIGVSNYGDQIDEILQFLFEVTKRIDEKQDKPTK